MIAGTSAGAMTGTVYAAGMETDDSIQSFVHVTPSWVFRKSPSGAICTCSQISDWPVRSNAEKYLKNARIEQLPIPMHTVTVDLVSGDAVVREKGDAVDEIIESINLSVLRCPFVALVSASLWRTGQIFPLMCR